MQTALSADPRVSGPQEQHFHRKFFPTTTQSTGVWDSRMNRRMPAPAICPHTLPRSWRHPCADDPLWTRGRAGPQARTVIASNDVWLSHHRCRSADRPATTRDRRYPTPKIPRPYTLDTTEHMFYSRGKRHSEEDCGPGQCIALPGVVRRHPNPVPLDPGPIPVKYIPSPPSSNGSPAHGGTDGGGIEGWGTVASGTIPPQTSKFLVPGS
jgi:hypothetical protein